MIENVYILVQTHNDGSETILYFSAQESIVLREKQEREWSRIQNTGTSRHDLQVVTFKRSNEGG